MCGGCPRVLLLNGGSSSGKSTLARSLQDVLDGYWLRFGVDALIEAAPAKILGVGGLHEDDDGTSVWGRTSSKWSGSGGSVLPRWQLLVRTSWWRTTS